MSTAELPLIDNENITTEEEKKNTTCQTNIVRAIEVTRILATIASIIIGFVQFTNSYRISAALFVFAMAGITGLESVFFGKISARDKKWESSQFQMQSACNNLASMVAMIILLSINATDAAVATLQLSVTSFFGLSGINHFLQAVKDKVKGKEVASIHWQRIILAIPLVIIEAIILSNWKPFK